MEGIGKHPPKMAHGLRTGVNGKRRSPAKVAKPPAIIQTHDMIGVSMRENDRVQPANIFSQDLQSKFRWRIDGDLCVV